MEEFAYDLPAELIAQRPSPQRGASRLMVVRRADGSLIHAAFAALPSFVPAGSVLVVNESRVFPARLTGRKDGGGKVDVLLVRRQPGAAEVWEVMVRASSRPRAGERVVFAPELWGRWEPGLGNGRAALRLFGPGEISAVLERVGAVPLPPYIRRPPEPEDRDRYQTVYAKHPGSVAAPTAGLHFTWDLLETLKEQGVEVLGLTLHVGPGTFRPVRCEAVEAHEMEAEDFVIGARTAARLEAARAQGRKVVAVGTTTARALEAAAASTGMVRAGRRRARLFIRPGYGFRVIDGLLTNFHLPRSTPLILVCALAGQALALKAYREAVSRGYRFYSYGDAMLVL